MDLRLLFQFRKNALILDHVLIVRWQNLTPDFERLAIERLGFAVLALCAVQRRQVLQAGSEIWMVCSVELAGPSAGFVRGGDGLCVVALAMELNTLLVEAGYSSILVAAKQLVPHLAPKAHGDSP
jgi:hypothetical protein